jgi:hypothetical protein
MIVNETNHIIFLNLLIIFIELLLDPFNESIGYIQKGFVHIFTR